MSKQKKATADKIGNTTTLVDRIVKKRPSESESILARLSAKTRRTIDMFAQINGISPVAVVYRIRTCKPLAYHAA